MRRKPNLLEKNLRKILIFLDKYVRGVDFLTVHDPSEFNFSGKIVFKNSPSGGYYLFNALFDLNISTNHKIIDIGCGKGAAINTMRKMPFSEICGIEIIGHLANIAEKNFKKLKTKNVKIINIDAREFVGYGDYDYFYFYNPFPKK